MFKKFLLIIFSVFIMTSFVSCSTDKTANTSKVVSDYAVLNLENSVSLLNEGLTAWKNKDIEKFVSILREKSNTPLDEYKSLVAEALNEPHQQIKDYKILDKNEVNKDYIVLYANIEWANGAVDEAKFKVMPSEGKLMVYLKEFGDESSKEIKKAE